MLGHVHVVPSGINELETEPTNCRWLDLIDYLNIKVGEVSKYEEFKSNYCDIKTLHNNC